MNEKNFWLVTIKIETVNEKGKIKKQSEKYLIKAVSATDAEAQVTKEMEGTIFDWSVSSITLTPIVAVIEPDKK